MKARWRRSICSRRIGYEEASDAKWLVVTQFEADRPQLCSPKENNIIIRRPRLVRPRGMKPTERKPGKFGSGPEGAEPFDLFRVGDSRVALSGGVAPGYYLVPLQGTKNLRLVFLRGDITDSRGLAQSAALRPTDKAEIGPAGHSQKAWRGDDRSCWSRIADSQAQEGVCGWA